MREAVPCAAYYHLGNFGATANLPFRPITAPFHLGKKSNMAKRVKMLSAPSAPIYLAKWRKTKFRTQQELADAMNTTAAAVSRIETGKREWNKGYLEALAYLVGCQVPDLFHQPDKARSTPGLSELMNLAGNLPEERLGHLIGLLGNGKAFALPEAPASEDPQERKAKAKPA
jgi:transcriptional regulator with XRE-family HTH domain